MGTTNSPSPQLERLAGELKCPICLSLYKQAASLSCNHCFCTSCIVQSMKRISCCPICKVPATPREVRSAPQMDSLVLIFKGMETSAGVSLFPTQPSQPKNFGAVAQRTHLKTNVPKPAKAREREKDTSLVENMYIGPPQKRQKGKSEAVHSEVANQNAVYSAECGAMQKSIQPLADGLDESVHDAFPAKRRNRVTHRATLASQRANKGVIKEGNQRIARNHGAEDVVMANSRSEVLDYQEIGGQGRAGNPSGSPHHLDHRISPTDNPYLDCSRGQPPHLSPFFWLRDDVLPSQDERPTQGTQTQLTAHPLRPSFSDLKGSDDEQSEDVYLLDEVACSELPEADSFDSDTFICTQRPCFPENSSSPVKNVGHAQLNNFNEVESLGKCKESFEGVEDKELTSPPKCSFEDNVAVEATQTPQLHQEPTRMVRGMVRGTLMKCSRLQIPDSGQSSRIVRRRLKSNGIAPSASLGRKKSLSKSVRSKAARKNPKKHKKAMSSDSGQETRSATNRTISPPHVLLDRDINKTLELCPPQGLKKGEITPKLPEINISGGEEATADEEMTQEFVDLGPACMFCGSAGDSEVAGPMVEYKETFPSRGVARTKTVHVHKLCAEWAPDVYFNVGEPKNLACEVKRGQKIKCSSCGMRGAALGCCNKRCKRSFHYPCGRATPGCKWDEDDFVMFCPLHAECKFPIRKRCRVSPPADPTSQTTEKEGMENSKKNAALLASTSGQFQRWPAGPACKWVVCGSGLDSQTKGQLAVFASLTGAAMVNRWSPSVTHVITGTDARGGAKRTLKFLMAVLQGKWIVKVEWMRDCMRTGQSIAEDKYEVSSDVNGFIGGPKRSRALAAARGPKLLEGLSFYFSGEFTSVSKEDLQSLIVAGRGVVLHRKPLPLQISPAERKARTKVPQTGQTLVVYSGDDGKGNAELREEAKVIAIHAGACAVAHTWLLDSIAACMLQPTS